MTNRDYTLSFTVAQSPDTVFAAIANVRGWWSQEISGGTEHVGDTFAYRYQDLHRCRIAITEAAPGKRIVWHVLDNYFSFTRDETEWKGTDIVFDIVSKDGVTEVTFTHRGLVPSYECFEACSQGWRMYVEGSLRDLIMTGRGRPNVGEAMTESERILAA